MDLRERLKGSLICGAIGDAFGAKYEGSKNVNDLNLDSRWYITDDTQLTLATCEAIFQSKEVLPEKVAERFLHWFNRRKLTGLGSSTLKALRELQVGGHWALVGRSGEFAAGNGAAMRIAPLAFKNNVSRQTIKDVSNITHKNDEAYTGALAVFYAIKSAIVGNWEGGYNLIEKILSSLPDTNVRDRLIEVNELSINSIKELGERFKSTAYVVDSVPIAIFAASRINEYSFESIIQDLIKLGGDTDTICSITGQIIGSLKGVKVIPEPWLAKYKNDLNIDDLIKELTENWKM